CHLQLEPLPVILTGLNAPLVQWQLAATLLHRQWPNELGVPLENAVVLTNPFPQTVSGSMRMVTPPRWRMLPKEMASKIGPGETGELPFETTLPFDTASGAQVLRFDFDIVADRRYQFSVYRTIEVGNDDVRVDIATRLNEQGELIVEQKFINQTDQP